MTKNTIDSTSDTRTANNTVRHQYRQLSDLEKQQMDDLKDMGETFIAKCNEVGATRETSIAKTKMEEAVMWAVKGLTA